MERQEFLEFITKEIVILDGATGSNLQDAGMKAGVCPEEWILGHPEAILDLQRKFVQAGTRILYAPTFTANRIKLTEYGYGEQVEAWNRELCSLTRQAAENGSERVLVAGDLTMTGIQLSPMGPMDFEELVEVYKEQVRSQRDLVDLFVVETMMSLQECRAALLAIKETCDLPVMVTLTFQEDGRTLYGTDAQTATIVMQAMGVDAVGVNCSTGPDKMCELIEQMKQVAFVPLIAKPNAGMPQLVGEKTCYHLSPEDFADGVARLVEAGASLVGGCCGSTPTHIEALAKKMKGYQPPVVASQHFCGLTNEHRSVRIDREGPFSIIGERINPTGKKALQQELREGSMDLVLDMAQEQLEQGAAVLDVNMGMNGIDEKERMLAAIEELSAGTDAVLSIDTSHVDIMEAALRRYPGRALINSISMESAKLKPMLVLAKKYGAMFILLPLSDAGLPASITEKHRVIQQVCEEAFAMGLTKEDIVVDGLVATVGANKAAALETLDTIRYCKQELGLATVCGLSNISFGLPERQLVNMTFLSLAIANGLTMAIANPSQELLVNMAYATDLLLNKEDADNRYIERVAQHPFALGTVTSKVAATSSNAIKTVNYPPIMEAVVKGRKKQIQELCRQALSEGIPATNLLDEQLIPGINEVGRLFEEKIYYLPQLIASAETMELGIAQIEPQIAKEKGDSPELGCVVLATVEGDIHDIGKNLVGLMLRNYGYRVIDLGKDVPGEEIVRVAKENNADLIGLSALMTTTMLQMKRVVELVRAEDLSIKVMIGGAVVTQSFADEIGADGYSADAGEAVKLAARLLAR